LFKKTRLLPALVNSTPSL